MALVNLQQFLNGSPNQQRSIQLNVKAVNYFYASTPADLGKSTINHSRAGSINLISTDVDVSEVHDLLISNGVSLIKKKQKENGPVNYLVDYYINMANVLTCTPHPNGWHDVTFMDGERIKIDSQF